MRQPIEWHKLCREIGVKIRLLKPIEEPREYWERKIRERAAFASKIAAKQKQFDEILQNVSFENKSKFTLLVRVWSGGVRVHVTRYLYCDETKEMRTIHNSKGLSLNATPEDFVKALFVACGQFEAHEFCESFKVYGRVAYFPHDSEVPYALAKGDRINRLILEPWRDIANQRTDLQIARRHIARWVRSTRPVRALVWLDAKAMAGMEAGLKLVRLALVTAIAMPSYFRAVVLVPQNSLQDSQNSSKDKAS